MTDSGQELTSRRITGKPRVIVTRHLLPSVEVRLRELFDVVLNEKDEPMDSAALAAAMQDCDVLVPTVTDRINADLIDQAGERLKLIASFGAGVDHIDLAAARARKMIVTNTPGVFTDDTADLTMAMVIGVPRRIREGTALIRRGEWTGWAPSTLLGRQIGGKILGIVGMGRIGQAVAHRARAFGLKIIYHNRNRLPPAVENIHGAEYVSELDELIARCDILTLHCPLTPATHHLINAQRLALMKPGSCVINTARAGLVDESALLDVLESGHLGGAGLDVFQGEPVVNPRILNQPNVMTLPHIGSATVEGREEAGARVIANIQFWADGHRPPDQVLEGLV